MEKFAINYNSLDNDLKPKQRVFRYEDVKDRLKKVAFDVVKFKDEDDISGLWQIQHTNDGDVIVAKYDDDMMTAASEETEKTASVNTDWDVVANESGSHLHVFYKKTPITKLAMTSLGLPESEADLVCGYLPESLASNKKLVAGLLSELPSNDRQELLNAFPELNN